MNRILSHTSTGIPVELALDPAGLTAAWGDDAGRHSASLTYADARAFLDGSLPVLALIFG